MRGYDRLQVDNYVAWAESELRAAQRLTTELVDRLAASETEAHRARQLMARSAQDRQLVTLSDRVAGMLRLAAQEAAASAEANSAEATQAQEVLAHARVEAEVVVRRARTLEARAAARLQDAERRLAEARTAEEQARSRVQAMLQEAADERDRLDAAADARRADVERELDDLLARRNRARQLLRRLTDRVDAALAVLADEPPAGYSFDANRAATPTTPDRRASRGALTA
jgi:cell division septum initiation protein DivIVA